MRVGEVEGADVGAEMAGVAGEGDVPERVGGLGGLLDDVELRAGGELRNCAVHSEEGVLGGVVEGVLGDEAGGR